MPNIVPDTLQVAVGVLVDNKRVLVSQRIAGTHLADYWEFPGGKIEAGESLEDALKREFYEELDIRISVITPLMEINYQYPEKEVLLKICRIGEYAGDVRGMQGQAVKWCGWAELEKLDFPPANSPILDYVRKEIQPD